MPSVEAVTAITPTGEEYIVCFDEAARWPEDFWAIEQALQDAIDDGMPKEQAQNCRLIIHRRPD